MTCCAIPALHKGLFVEDLARQLVMVSEDEARDGGCIWEARRHYMRPSDKLTSLKLWSKQSEFP
jgi:hypothetical protein